MAMPLWLRRVRSPFETDKLGENDAQPKISRNTRNRRRYAMNLRHKGHRIFSYSQKEVDASLFPDQRGEVRILRKQISLYCAASKRRLLIDNCGDVVAED